MYGVGYKGGEALLEKRMPKAKFEKIKKSFEDHEFLALMFPAMLPPPTPYKLIVLSAAAFEMDWRKFLFAIFLGRVVRFLILSVLVMYFGPEIVSFLSTVIGSHLKATLIVLAAIAVLALLLCRARKNKRSPEQAEEV